MTGRAVFGDRRVFPHERSALVGVTLETGFVRRLVLEQFVAGAAMDVVTSRAGHFSGIDRMRKRAMLIHTYDLVTRATNFWLRCRLENGIPRRVTAVATAARNFIDRMCGRMPTRADLLLVTGSAHTVLRCDRRQPRGRNVLPADYWRS